MMIVLATICCRFGRWGLVKKLNFCSDIEHKVWSRFWSWSSGKIWSWSLINFFLLMFCRGYVEPKLNLGRDSEARFGQDFEAIVLWRGWCLVEILKLMLDQNSEIWSRFVFELVIRTQPSGPLCLWQSLSLYHLGNYPKPQFDISLPPPWLLLLVPFPPSSHDKGERSVTKRDVSISTVPLFPFHQPPI